MSDTETTTLEPANGTDASNRASRPKPAKILPTDRIRFDKQLDILRAFAAASGHERKPVSAKEVGALVDMAESTISQIVPFFVDVGLLVREKKAVDNKGFTPAAEVTAYQKAHDWDKGNAAKKLAPLLASAWFNEALMPKLKFRLVNEKEAINDLGEIAAVGPDKEASLRTVIDYMAAAALVERDGAGMLRATSAEVPGVQTPSAPAAPQSAPPPPPAPPLPVGVSQHQMWLLEILNAYPELEDDDQNAILKLIKTIKGIGKRNASPVSE